VAPSAEVVIEERRSADWLYLPCTMTRALRNEPGIDQTASLAVENWLREDSCDRHLDVLSCATGADTYDADLISIFLLVACTFFGMTISSTPFFIVAVTASASQPSGRASVR
jgi:hypothetical protein